MAILDFLVPDLAPEQYSSGQGTGYAQQYNLGAPNPFDVAQQYADKAVQTKKLQLEKDLLNEKNRQEAFSKYITDIKYDPKWVIAESNFEQEVDDIGNFISEWRASGKPVNTEFQIELNKKKAKLNSLKGMNEETFTRYNKNIEKMLEGLGKDYEKEDIAKYENEIKKAYEQGGIEAGFNKVNQIRPLKEFDISKHFLADFPKPESSADGRTSDQVKEEMDDHTNNKWMAMTQDRQQQVIDDLYYANKIKEKTPDEAINYIRNNVVDLYNQRRVGEDKTKPIEINQHFSKYYPKPEYLDALNSDQVKEELDLYNENRWFDLGDKKQEIVDRLFKDGLIETATLADAKKYTRNIVDLYNNPVKRQGRAATKSADEKRREKTELVPTGMFDTSVRDDGFELKVPTSAEFYNTKGEFIYMKPAYVTPKSGDGVVLVGKRLAKEGDRGYFETKEEADSAYEKWKKANSGKSASVEQDPETKKYIIVTGDEEYIPIGKGSNAQKNLAKFEAEYGYNLEDEFKKLAIELDKAEGTKPGTWMDREFYGKSQGAGTTSGESKDQQKTTVKGGKSR
jgi:hypothetical protein